MTATTITPTATSVPSPVVRATPITARLVRGVGFVGIVGGIVLIAGGAAVWGTVTQQLAAEHITVSADSPLLPGAAVDGPITAYAQATIINHHALTMAKGKTYAELAQDDPIRSTVMDASFLRASLFTSVVSFGVAAFAAGMGVLSGLFGWVILTMSPSAKKRRATS